MPAVSFLKLKKNVGVDYMSYTHVRDCIPNLVMDSEMEAISHYFSVCYWKRDERRWQVQQSNLVACEPMFHWEHGLIDDTVEWPGWDVNRPPSNLVGQSLLNSEIVKWSLIADGKTVRVCAGSGFHGWRAVRTSALTTSNGMENEKFKALGYGRVCSLSPIYESGLQWQHLEVWTCHYAKVGMRRFLPPSNIPDWLIGLFAGLGMSYSPPTMSERNTVYVDPNVNCLYSSATKKMFDGLWPERSPIMERKRGVPYAGYVDGVACCLGSYSAQGIKLWVSMVGIQALDTG